MACMHSHPRRPQDGFTLVELTLAVTILAIVATAAGPSLATAIANNRGYSAQLELAASLALARSEAARRNVNVIVSANAPVSGNELSGGWTVWADVNGNGVRDSDEPIVRSHEALAPQVKLSGPESVTYGPTGFVVPAAAQSYTVCGTHAAYTYTVTVQANGLADLAEIPPTCS